LKKVTIVNHSLPLPNANGGPITVWAIINELVNLGIKVQVIALKYPDDYHINSESALLYEDLGVSIEVLNIEGTSSTGFICGLASKIPTLSYIKTIYALLRNSAKVNETILKFDPNMILMYHWESIALMKQIRNFPKYGLLGDPINKPLLSICKYNLSKTKGITLRNVIFLLIGLFCSIPAVLLMRLLIRSCDKCTSFQKGEINYLSCLSSRTVTYHATPVSDIYINNSLNINNGKQAISSESHTSILLGPSNLNSTVTSAGLDFFINSVYPYLKYSDKFLKNSSIRVVGEGRPSSQLLSIANESPNIVLLGRVDPPDDEFVRSRIQLSLTPFVLGNRVRIITGMMHSMCIIAHNCEAVNIPELINGTNCLLSDSGEVIASYIIRLLEQPEEILRLGRNARTTYERFNKPSVSIPSLLS
jgi:hypothetical protein